MKLAIYTSDFNTNQIIIDEILNFLRLDDYDDFFICSSTINNNVNNYAILQPFYITFFEGFVVFLNMDEYLEYKDKIIGSKILYVDPENKGSQYIFDKRIFKDCSFITYDDNKQLIKVNNYVIQ
jgi:hypothetical protein